MTVPAVPWTQGLMKFLENPTPRQPISTLPRPTVTQRGTSAFVSSSSTVIFREPRPGSIRTTTGLWLIKATTVVSFPFKLAFLLVDRLFADSKLLVN